ncbi:MAG: DUF494 family protein [Burkholderiaceae bacterium]
MFDVLVYVYENYWRGDACPQLEQLERKLSSVGFDSDQIREALVWLNGLNFAARSAQDDREDTRALPLAQAPDSLRVYTSAEQQHLGAQALSFLCFLDNAGVLPAPMREIVIDRAMAAPGAPVPIDDLKIIVMMVYWSFGEEPDALVLDELCDDTHTRVPH